jgi:hypothetical protein
MTVAQEADISSGQRYVLDDARRRLVALTGDLQSDTIDEAALLRTAAALDTVMHRIRWVVGVNRHGEGR